MGLVLRLSAVSLSLLLALPYGGAPAGAATIAASTKPKLVTAADVQSVIDYIASKGDTVTQSADSDGKPVLTESGNLYQLWFYDCSDAHDQCETLQFLACYSGYAQGNVTKTNDWTKRYIKVKSYIDNGGNVCISETVATGKGGISYEAMDGTFDSFLWFRQNAADQFK